MAKQNISARVPTELLSRLEKLAETTGKSMTSLINEAIAQYVGADVDAVGDRLTRLETQVTGILERLDLGNLRGR